MRLRMENKSRTQNQFHCPNKCSHNRPLPVVSPALRASSPADGYFHEHARKCRDTKWKCRSLLSSCTDGGWIWAYAAFFILGIINLAVTMRKHRYLPDIDHEVLHEVEYTWKIDNFSKLKQDCLITPFRKVFSNNIIVDGQNWYESGGRGNHFWMQY